MATNEYEDEPAPTYAQKVAGFVGASVTQVTDTDRGLPLRTWVLIIVIGLCTLFAPLPFNVVGVIATLALAMSAPARNRG